MQQPRKFVMNNSDRDVLKTAMPSLVAFFALQVQNDEYKNKGCAALTETAEKYIASVTGTMVRSQANDGTPSGNYSLRDAHRTSLNSWEINRAIILSPQET